MPYGKRRKGKQGKRSPAIPQPEDSRSQNDKTEDDGPKDTTNPTSESTGKKEEAEGVDNEMGHHMKISSGHACSTTVGTGGNQTELILTSEQRMGIYECDYCHSDISQLPRIRCAVCPDFDLCLDCFVTTDHTAAIARLKAAATAAADPGSSGLAGTVTSAAINHEDSHGYRVCLSTRFPLFPTSRNVIAVASKGNNASSLNLASGDDKSEAGDDTDEKKKSATSSPQPPSNKDEDEEMEDTEKGGDGDGKTDIISKGAEKNIDDSPKIKSAEAKQKGTPSVTGDDDGTMSDNFVLSDDPRAVWTIEEDLRLIEGIRSHGLGNWVEVSEAVSGQGSTGKTPKRCMERYFDDFLGRFGHILPPLMLEKEDTDDTETEKATGSSEPASKNDDGETVRASKRRAVLLRSPSVVSTGSSYRKKFKATPTESISGYQNVWPDPYIPKLKDVKLGQEVGREQSYKAEQTYVKLISSVDKPEEVEKIRKEWEKTRLGKPGGPTVLPVRPEDVPTMPGAELAGFMVRRGDFDVEWHNEAEQSIADMEFLPNEPQEDKELKLKVLAIYNSKLDEREKRKQFALSRRLYNYRKVQAEEEKLPQDERDLVHRMRLFERFHTPEEHKQFLSDLLKAKRLRKEIAKLQTYRRLGIRTLAEAEMYELDKVRRSFHKTAKIQKEAEAAKAADGSAGSQTDASAKGEETVSSSYWKQYRTADRRVRKSINRGSSFEGATDSNKDADTVTTENPGTKSQQDKESLASQESMDVDDNQSAQRNPRSSKNPDNDPEDDLSKLPGFELLSRREADLCRKLELSPMQYGDIKKALIHESFVHGLLDKESQSSGRRTLAMIDAERRDGVIDFVVRAGWISTKFGDTMRDVVSESSPSKSDN